MGTIRGHRRLYTWPSDPVMPEQENFPTATVGDASLTVNSTVKNNNEAVDRQIKSISGFNRHQDTDFTLNARPWTVNTWASSEQYGEVHQKYQNYGNDSADQIFEVGDNTFIDGIEASDIAQGEAGDCWFLSSLCSFANYINERGGADNALLERVIQKKQNEILAKNGAYQFQFYRMGEWNKVLIDEQLPLKIFKKRLATGRYRRGVTFDPANVEDYWALLLEKAFAKFVGGYMQLEGGFPRCAVTHLSGGITTADDIDCATITKQIKEDNIFKYLESIEETSLVVVSNHDNDSDGEDMGLIAGHAYSVEDFEELRNSAGTVLQRLVLLRNPWGEGEWLGDYSDDWFESNRSEFLSKYVLDEEQLEKFGEVSGDLKENTNDGKFWMSWDDFLSEFESLSVCHLDDPSEMERRAVGTFSYGQNGNSPTDKDALAVEYLDPKKHVQVRLTVKTGGLIKFQLLLDSPMKPRRKNKELDQKLVFVAVHEAPAAGGPVAYIAGTTMTKLQLYEADLIQPRLPIIPKENEFKGYRFENYDFNGWVYDFVPGEYVIVLASCPSRSCGSIDQVADCNYVFRARSQHGRQQAAFELASI